ncbi:hypothetical protein HK102_001208 [Quaeritorhiza haematococci]|nr:hypothetical protein HK102_001208 [Quaeritorhiza haematococci]
MRKRNRAQVAECLAEQVSSTVTVNGCSELPTPPMMDVVKEKADDDESQSAQPSHKPHMPSSTATAPRHAVELRRTGLKFENQNTAGCAVKARKRAWDEDEDDATSAVVREGVPKRMKGQEKLQEVGQNEVQSELSATISKSFAFDIPSGCTKNSATDSDGPTKRDKGKKPIRSREDDIAYNASFSPERISVRKRNKGKQPIRGWSGCCASSSKDTTYSPAAIMSRQSIENLSAVQALDLSAVARPSGSSVSHANDGPLESAINKGVHFATRKTEERSKGNENPQVMDVIPTEPPESESPVEEETERSKEQNVTGNSELVKLGNRQQENSPIVGETGGKRIVSELTADFGQGEKENPHSPHVPSSPDPTERTEIMASPTSRQQHVGEAPSGGVHACLNFEEEKHEGQTQIDWEEETVEEIVDEGYVEPIPMIPSHPHTNNMTSDTSDATPVSFSVDENNGSSTSSIMEDSEEERSDMDSDTDDVSSDTSDVISVHLDENNDGSASSFIEDGDEEFLDMDSDTDTFDSVAGMDEGFDEELEHSFLDVGESMDTARIFDGDIANGNYVMDFAAGAGRLQENEVNMHVEQAEERAEVQIERQAGSPELHVAATVSSHSEVSASTLLPTTPTAQSLAAPPVAAEWVLRNSERDTDVEIPHRFPSVEHRHSSSTLTSNADSATGEGSTTSIAESQGGSCTTAKSSQANSLLSVEDEEIVSEGGTGSDGSSSAADPGSDHLRATCHPTPPEPFNAPSQSGQSREVEQESVKLALNSNCRDGVGLGASSKGGDKSSASTQNGGPEAATANACLSSRQPYLQSKDDGTMPDVERASDAPSVLSGGRAAHKSVEDPQEAAAESVQPDVPKQGASVDVPEAVCVIPQKRKVHWHHPMRCEGRPLKRRRLGLEPDDWVGIIPKPHQDEASPANRAA